MHAMLYGVAMGVAGGVVTLVFFPVWGRTYGRPHLGQIQGCAQTMTVLGSALGIACWRVRMQARGAS